MQAAGGHEEVEDELEARTLVYRLSICQGIAERVLATYCLQEVKQHDEFEAEQLLQGSTRLEDILHASVCSEKGCNGPNSGDHTDDGDLFTYVSMCV